MSLIALLASALLDLAAPGSKLLACHFPAPDPGKAAISVKVEATPSLQDRADLFHIRMHLGRVGEYGGLVQPIDRTDDRDVLIHAKTAGDIFYSIGLRDDGQAALNRLTFRDKKASKARETRSGTCSNFENYLDDWLTS